MELIHTQLIDVIVKDMEEVSQISLAKGCALQHTACLEITDKEGSYNSSVCRINATKDQCLHNNCYNSQVSAG